MFDLIMHLVNYESYSDFISDTTSSDKFVQIKPLVLSAVGSYYYTTIYYINIPNKD